MSDEVDALARAEFFEQALAYLSSAVASINVWNRLGVGYRWTYVRSAANPNPALSCEPEQVKPAG